MARKKLTQEQVGAIAMKGKGRDAWGRKVPKKRSAATKLAMAAYPTKQGDFVSPLSSGDVLLGLGGLGLLYYGLKHEDKKHKVSPERQTVAEQMSDFGFSGKVVKRERVGNNTLRIELDDGRTIYRLHNTDVVSFDGKGGVVLNSGGWRTPTTKDRINEYSPVKVESKHGIWMVGDVPFYDGIVVDSIGKVKGAKKGVVQVKKALKEKEKIKSFLSKVDKLDKIPMPDNGDCWFCLMKTQGGKTMGDVAGDTDHLESHIKEGYIPGALIYNALKEAGFPHPEVIIETDSKDSVKRALKKYLEKRLLFPQAEKKGTVTATVFPMTGNHPGIQYVRPSKDDVDKMKGGD
jgi:hypothetical protein